MNGRLLWNTPNGACSLTTHASKRAFKLATIFLRNASRSSPVNSNNGLMIALRHITAHIMMTSEINPKAMWAIRITHLTAKTLFTKRKTTRTIVCRDRILALSAKTVSKTTTIDTPSSAMLGPTNATKCQLTSSDPLPRARATPGRRNGTRTYAAVRDQTDYDTLRNLINWHNAQALCYDSSYFQYLGI
jgi:hypothetical protein